MRTMANALSSLKRWQYPIHASCTTTETALLQQAFSELEVLAQHAKDHIMRFGNDSSFYRKYFGDANTAEPAGWYEKVLHSDKAGVLFRCDDIDGNCHQEGQNTFVSEKPYR
jgi:hypothetical protein